MCAHRCMCIISGMGAGASTLRQNYVRVHPLCSATNTMLPHFDSSASAPPRTPRSAADSRYKKKAIKAAKFAFHVWLSAALAVLAEPPALAAYAIAFLAQLAALLLARLRRWRRCCCR